MKLTRAFVLLVALSACGSDTPGGTSTTKPPGVPARIDVVASPTASVSAGGSAGALNVRVVDAAGVAVPGVTVTFSTVGSLISSAGAGLTDANGTTTTSITAGTTAGPGSVRATASGVATAVNVAINVVAGAATKIVSNPKSIRFASIGETQTIVASAQDQYGNAVGPSAISWSSLNPALVTVDASGLVRAVTAGGTTNVIATSGIKADTTAVTVLAANASICTGLATAQTLAVGESMTVTSQYGCVAGTAAGAEFAVVAFNSSTDQTALINLSVTGAGIAAPPAAASLTPNSEFTSLTHAALAAARQPEERFHSQLLSQAHTRFGGRFHSARESMRAQAGARALVAPGTPSVSYAAIPPSAKVGDLLTMNVSAGTCTLPINRGLRVMAVGTKSIILADTLNPANGFTTADFQRYAANFDTLIYPMNVAAFGSESDMDSNGKVGIIFTRAVNELVDASSGYFIGGFFNYRDIFPKKGATAADDCPGSNEAEVLYLVVPATTPINGVVHSVGFVDSLVNNIVAHEFQHLISAERRLFVNTASEDFETLWLAEGMSHVAEELLYFRQSGWATRQNLDDPKIRIQNPLTFGFFAMDIASNFNRLGLYLSSPSLNSPYGNDDQLATRGATWSFLRYVADQLGTTDGTFWQKMENSTSTGFGTLLSAIGSDPTPYFRNWAVANFMDDFAGGTDPKFQHKSWNYRSIYGLTFPKYNGFPLPSPGLSNNVKFDIAIRGGSAAYYRMAVAAGKDGLLTFSSGGGAPAAPLQFVVVRTK